VSIAGGRRPHFPLLRHRRTIEERHHSRLRAEKEDAITRPQGVVPVAKNHQVRTLCTTALFSAGKLPPLRSVAPARLATAGCLLVPLFEHVHHRRWMVKPPPSFVLRSTCRIRSSCTPSLQKIRATNLRFNGSPWSNVVDPWSGVHGLSLPTHGHIPSVFL
jgi:hypothetical protein